MTFKTLALVLAASPEGPLGLTYSSVQGPILIQGSSYAPWSTTRCRQPLSTATEPINKGEEEAGCGRAEREGEIGMVRRPGGGGGTYEKGGFQTRLDGEQGQLGA